MAFVYPNSTPCSKSELDLFTTPPTQVVMQKGQWIDHQPVSSISTSAPIEFNVIGTEDYVDLSKTMLVVKAKITKNDGSALAIDEKTAPVNNFLQSLFKQVDVFLNGVQVTQSTGTYSYRSFYETILNFGPAAKESHLTAGLFYKDTAGNMDSTDPTLTNANTNLGLKNRYGFTEESALVDLFGPIYCDLFYSERLLLNHMNITVKLTPNNSAFCLMSGEAAPNYKVVIQNAVLKVHQIKVNPVLKLEHARELQKGNMAKYPIRRTECKAFTIPSGNPSIHKSDLFNGNIPTRVVLGMVDSTAFNGSYTKNPYNFKLYGATSVSLTVDGEQIPFKPINLKLSAAGGQNFIEAYQTLFSGTGMLYQNAGNDISRKDYANGHGLLVFDLTPDQCSSSTHLNQKQKGNVSLEIQFTTGLANAINLVVYGEFESIIQVDQGRHVIKDYSG